MAVTSYADWSSLCQEATARGFISGGWPNSGFAGTAVAPASTYSRFARPDATVTPPGAPAVCTQYDAGALVNARVIPSTSAKRLWLAEIEWGLGVSTASVRNTAMIHDRLCHMSGLDASVTTEQTFNLPTAPLPRYTSGEGVMLCLETYNGSGTTGSTVIVKYTNQAGVSGRLSQPAVLGGSAGTWNAPLVLFPVSLQDGDTGVRSVESVTLSGSTGSPGNFGVTLIKPLGFSSCDTSAQSERNAWKNMLFGGCVNEVLPGACLSAAIFGQPGTTCAMAMVGRIGVVAA